MLRELADLLSTSDFETGLRWWAERGPKTGPEAYAFSKEAVIYYAKTRAHAAWSTDYRVNTVSPGATLTPLLQDFSQYMPIRWSEEALGRHATPEDVAAVVVFLLGSRSRFVNGVDVAVDGGTHVRPHHGHGSGALRGSPPSARDRQWDYGELALTSRHVSQ